MLVITGVFENERLIPDKPVSIPQKKRVVVTIEEEKSVATKPKMTLREMNCDEELSMNDIFDKHLYTFGNFKFNRNEANNYE
jgi:hypothetical protein